MTGRYGVHWPQKVDANVRDIHSQPIGPRTAKAGVSMGPLVTWLVAPQIGPGCWPGLGILPMHNLVIQAFGGLIIVKTKNLIQENLAFYTNNYFMN